MSRVMLVCPEPLGKSQPAGIGIRFLEMRECAARGRSRGHAPLRDRSTPEQLRDVSATARTWRSCRATSRTTTSRTRGRFRRSSTCTIRTSSRTCTTTTSAARSLRARSRHVAQLAAARRPLPLRVGGAAPLLPRRAAGRRPRQSGHVRERSASLDSLIASRRSALPPPRAGAAPAPHRSRASSSAASTTGTTRSWPSRRSQSRARCRLTLTFTTSSESRHHAAGQTRARRCSTCKRTASTSSSSCRGSPYDERGAFFDRFAAALLTFPQSLETDLSMRTRVYDYLWGGLPIVSSSAPGTDEHPRAIRRRRDRGNDPADIRESAPARDRDADRRRGARFVEDHQWSRTLAPLVDFCRAPRIDRTRSVRVAHAGAGASARRSSTASSDKSEAGSEPSVDVIVVNWNGREDTLACLDARDARSCATCTARSSRSSTTARPTARIAAITHALSRTSASSRSARTAASPAASPRRWRARTARNVVFLNNDAVPEPGWLAALARRDRRGAGRRGLRRRQDRRPRRQADRLHRRRDDVRRPRVPERLSHAARLAPGAGGGRGDPLRLRRQHDLAPRALLDLGGFDDDYFAYLEDVDFGWRTWIAGGRALFEPRAVVRHASSATSNRLGDFERGVLFERNALQTALKNYEDARATPPARSSSRTCIACTTTRRRATRTRGS